MWFESWQGLLRVVLVGAAAYAALVFLLRIAGKRPLAKLNAFDLIVTVALGSALSTVLLDKKIPLAEGVLAFIVLLGLQFTVAWASTRSTLFTRAVRAQPRIVFRDGQFLHDAMESERLTESDVLAAIRGAHVGAKELVDAVVLETSGELSVVVRSATVTLPRRRSLRRGRAGCISRNGTHAPRT